MKLSICIPVYNVAPYIEQCARSLFGQTYANLEYVFVDDCSPDDSVDILRRVLADYPQRANQVKILRMKENSGPVGARKAALENVTGELVTFCDSDDWLDVDLYAKVVPLFDDEKTDMVWFSARCEYGSFARNDDHDFFDGDARAFLSLAGMRGFDCLWNKVFRRDVMRLRDVEWPDTLRTSEDLCLVTQIVQYCRRIRNLNESYYHYRQRPASLSRAQGMKRMFDDVVTTYGIITRGMPLDLTMAVRSHLTDFILYYGVRSGVLDRRSFSQWQAAHRATGGRYDFPWLNADGRRYMRLAAFLLPLARLYELVRKDRIGYL